MAPPKKEKMPSMKELQELLAVLDAEGGLAIGGAAGEEAESANLDDLYEDSYFHAILHNNVQELSINVAHTDSEQDTADEKSVPPQNQENQQQETRPSGVTTEFKVLQLPKECSWGDDHESLGSQLLVRSGYAAVLSALTQSSSAAQSIFVAAGSPGIGKSCLAYYLAHKLFEAGHDLVVSDPMFTNALINRQYYSCYSPHLEKHSTIFQAITSAPPVAGSTPASKKATWWICDDGFLPIRGTKCQVVVSSTTSAVDRDIDVIRKKNKLPLPIQFQIPQWSLDEIKAGLLVSLSSVTSSGATPIAITKEQDVVLESLFSKYKGNPKKIFTWVKANWISDGSSSQKSGKTKSKSKLKSKVTRH
ncbi:hypothetical protein BGZ72_005664 [Mortierella alpina]|nr:hypothetical protein BGZ72_005664 [Mortierella alpina]